MPKSLIEYAYEFMCDQAEGAKFNDMWDYVVKESGLDEATAADKVSRFYTNLMLDGRFVILGDNLWDLRSRHTFDKVHIDMAEVYSEVEEETTSNLDSEEADEEKEYNAAFEEPKNSIDDEDESPVDETNAD